MGPISGVMFLVGVIIVAVSKDRDTFDLLTPRFGKKGDTEHDRKIFLIQGIFLIIVAVVIWVYLLINGGEPVPLYDYSSYLNQSQSSSQ